MAYDLILPLAKWFAMTIPVKLSTLQTLNTPIDAGLMVYGKFGDQYRYAITVAVENPEHTARHVLYSDRKRVFVHGSDSSVWPYSSFVVAKASELFFRCAKAASDCGDYFNRLSVDGASKLICGRLIQGKTEGRPKFIDVERWAEIGDDDVSATGQFWAEEWQLVLIDSHGQETVVIDAKVGAQGSEVEYPDEPEETFGL